MNKKYKVIINYHDGSMRCSESKIIEATDEDTAIDSVVEQFEMMGYEKVECNDCYEIVEHPLLKKTAIFDMPDGMTYGLPVEYIARHRAKRYAHEFNNDVAESLKRDTIPLFESNYWEIGDWATNNMNWSDVVRHVVVLKKAVKQFDMEDGWLAAEFKIN